MKIKNTYSASLENLEKIFADAEKFCEEINADAKTTYALNLSLDEIFTNIVSYGYKGDSSKNVEIELEKSNDEIVTTISDTAPRFNPLIDAKSPDTDANLDDREIGGLGIFFIRKNMNKVSYKYENGKNQLSMARKIAE
jgi:serine/threonine-protein kinase RsbW